MIKTEIRTDLKLCPQCGGEINAHTGIDKNVMTVREGDFSVCFYCASTLRFTDDYGNFRLTTPAEIDELANHHPMTYSQLMQAQDAIKRRVKAPPSDRNPLQGTETPLKPS